MLVLLLFLILFIFNKNDYNFKYYNKLMEKDLE